MTAATRTGALYALIVFLIGFIFGTIRILLLAPRLGEIAAVPLETLVMLATAIPGRSAFYPFDRTAFRPPRRCIVRCNPRMRCRRHRIPPRGRRQGDCAKAGSNTGCYPTRLRPFVPPLNGNRPHEMLYAAHH